MKTGKSALRRSAYWLVGSHGKNDSRLGRFTTYFILTGMGFVFLYPLLYMLSVSFMDTEDLVDATVTWIPTHLSVESFVKAAKTLQFWDGLKDSLIMTAIPAALQTFTLALAGYGLALYRVPGKRFWLVLAVFLAGLAADLLLAQAYLTGTSLLVCRWLCLVLGVVVLSISVYYFHLVARYENTVRQHAMNAAILALVKLPRTVLMVLLTLLPVLVLLISMQTFVSTLIFWVILGFSFVSYLQSCLLRPVFHQLEPPTGPNVQLMD